jgi:hypothetical protein
VQKPVQNGGMKLTLDLTPGIVTLGRSQNFGPKTGWDGTRSPSRPMYPGFYS